MKIMPGVLTMLVVSLANAVQVKELMRTSVPESAKATVEKIADDLCLVDKSPDLQYAVKLADRIYDCDEEATGMIANLETTVVSETFVLKSHSNHHGLAVVSMLLGPVQKDVLLRR
jgi:hypothetical protein